MWRGTTRVFDDLSLTIGQREHVAILGPNGAGKTTLLRLLTRELYPVKQPDTYVRILGRDVWNVAELRRHLGIVSHDLQSDYSHWVIGRDIVLSGCSVSVGLKGVPYEFSDAERSAASAIMDQLGISELADTRLDSMSTGQQRRFLLGRALVTSPDTLVLDEPTEGLDLTATFQYLASVQDLMALGISVVLVTHHVNEIPPGVERIVLLKDGRIAASGDADFS